MKAFEMVLLDDEGTPLGAVPVEDDKWHEAFQWLYLVWLERHDWPRCASCKVRYDPETLHHVDTRQDDHWPCPQDCEECHASC